MDALVTNFHLPESTLVMLVSAFAGREHILNAYRTAVQEKYRFFSFGDAMFIGVGISENGDQGKKPAISSVSEDVTVPDGENDETDR